MNGQSERQTVSPCGSQAICVLHGENQAHLEVALPPNAATVTTLLEQSTVFGGASELIETAIKWQVRVDLPGHNNKYIESRFRGMVRGKDHELTTKGKK